MKPEVKFSCKTNDIITAVKKHCGIDKVVVESKDDIPGLISSLLGGSGYVEVNKVQIKGDDAIIELEMPCDSFDSFNPYKNIGEFVESVKKLQQLLGVAKKT